MLSVDKSNTNYLHTYEQLGQLYAVRSSSDQLIVANSSYIRTSAICARHASRAVVTSMSVAMLQQCIRQGHIESCYQLSNSGTLSSCVTDHTSCDAVQQRPCE